MATIMRVGGGTGGGKSANPAVSTLAEKDILLITEDGIPTEYYIAKHGYEPELNKDRTLLVRKDIHSSRVWHTSNVNALATSAVDEWLNGDFFNSLSSGVRDLLDATEFRYTIGGGNTTVSTLKRAVFMLSLTEYGLTAGFANVEGSALPIANTLRVAYLNGTATAHWTRTPGTDSSAGAYAVNTSGAAAGATCGSSNGIRPCFTIPSSATVIGPDNYGKYSLEVETASEVYGIARDITASSPEWVRTDGSMTFTAKASIGTMAGESSFDNIYPWSEMKRVTLDTGDVMVRIPKFYYGRYRNGNIERIQISGRADVGLTLHPAFNHGGVEADAIYVGAYKTSSNNKSVSGATPQGNQTSAAFRTNAEAKGDGWGLLDISTLSAIQMLYLVEYANNNSQAMIGRGYCDGNSAALNTGTCDVVPNLTGRPTGTDGKTDIVYRGIEGIWGNLWEFVDGCAIGGVSYHITNDPSQYSGDISAYPKLSYSCASWSNAYVTGIGFDEANPHIMLPTAASGGSETTHFCDITSCVASGWRIILISGYRNIGGRIGIFVNAMGELTNYSNSDTGSRLIYIPQ